MRAWTLVSLAGGALFWSAGGCYLEPLEHDYRGDRVAPLPMRQLPDRTPEVVVDDDGYATLSGQVKSWFTLEYVDGVSLTTVGTVPEITGAAGGPQASFSLEVPLAGVFWMKAAKEGYPSTYEYVRMPQGDYPEKTAYIISQTQLDDMAEAYGKTVNANCGTVLAELKNPLNQGQKDVSGVRLEGMDAEGPYFLGAQNEADPGRTYTSESGRVVFFNVCDPGGQSASPGATVELTVDDPDYALQQTAYLNVYAGGATRGVVTVEADGVPPPPPDEVVIDFEYEIYPIFVQEACAACHAPGGTAAGTGMYFDGPAEEVYALLREGNQRVNLQDPGASLVLTNPLYEDPPDHPNASFPSVNHPDYQAVYRWIEQGAPWGVEPPPDVDAPVDFAADVYPRFQTYSAANYPYGRGCADCHNADVYSGSLNLTGGADVVYQRLYDKGLFDTGNVGESKILKYPYCGPNKCADEGIAHGTLVFANTDDPDYQLIYQWVSQGAVHDGSPPDGDLPTDVSFTDDVVPFFEGLGCTLCHGVALVEGNLDLTGTPQEIYDAVMVNSVVPGDYANSLLYTSPNAANPEVPHSGTKPVSGPEDDYARYVAGWIYEGASY